MFSTYADTNFTQSLSMYLLIHHFYPKHFTTVAFHSHNHALMTAAAMHTANLTSRSNLGLSVYMGGGIEPPFSGLLNGLSS